MSLYIIVKDQYLTIMQLNKNLTYLHLIIANIWKIFQFWLIAPIDFFDRKQEENTIYKKLYQASPMSPSELLLAVTVFDFPVQS